MMAILGFNFHVNINQFQNLKNLEMEVFTITSINSKSKVTKIATKQNNQMSLK
jgi:hypothetical protein